jgi:hypothetical protein
MKKILSVLVVVSVLVLTGCFETAQEITLNEDGTGTVVNANDMSAMMGLAKQMAGKDLEKIGDEKMDTSFSMASRVDSIEGLSEEEKTMLKTATLQIMMNVKDEKFLTKMNFPFTKTSQVATMNRLSSKLMQDAIADQLGDDQAMNPMGEKTTISSFDDYYISEFSNGLLVRSLNKEKYALAPEDKYLKSLREASSMGMPLTATYIINLPRPAKKAEGKGILLSEDRKKVTVKADIDDFFIDPAKLEYRIEY